MPGAKTIRRLTLFALVLITLGAGILIPVFGSANHGFLSGGLLSGVGIGIVAVLLLALLLELGAETNARPLPLPLSASAGKFWRWVFLCALTIHLALLFIIVCESTFHRGLDFAAYPLRTRFLGIAYALPTLFLLLASPLFFRRLGALAIVAWFTLIVELACSALVEFLPHFIH